MDCPRCGKKIESGWNFCPFCGFRPDDTPQMFGGAFGGVFNNLMKRLARQMEDINRQTREMERDFEVMDLSPLFRDVEKNKISVIGKPIARGFTVKIARAGGRPPKVDVKTFGNMDETMQRQLQQQLKKMGISPAMKERQLPKPKEEPQKPAKSKSFPVPKSYEEPKTSVKRMDSKVFVDMDIPGVKSEDDIEIKELENSVEVRAMAGDKAFFKILTKPPEFSLNTKDFKNGRLHLEFG